MLAVYAYGIVEEENVDKFIEIARKLVGETVKESGNVSYELIRGVSDRKIFAFLEKWESKEALDLHMKTEHFTSLVPELGKLMNGEMKIQAHEVIV